MRFKDKGFPLFVTFRHVDYTNEKTGEIFHKTIAKSVVDPQNVPCVICDKFFEMFANDKVNVCWESTIYAETVCKSSDTNNPEIGERIARKKIMKKYMSMVKQAAKAQAREYLNQASDLIFLSNDAERCQKEIIDYLKNQ